LSGTPFTPDYAPRPDVLADRVILVTGAGDGIGRAMAQAYAAHGATVILLGRTTEKLEAVYDAIVARSHPEPVIHPQDLAALDDDACRAMAEAIDQQFGRLDGLLHNASLLGPRVPLAYYDTGAWRRVLEVNLTACFLLTRALLPALTQAPDASVVFTSSGAGRPPRANRGAYGISKGAVDSLMEVFADEHEQLSAIRFTSVDPGGTRTAMRAAAYPGEDPSEVPPPEHLIPLYVYLMSADAAAVRRERIDARAWLQPER